MKTLHITPGDSACGSLRQAIRLADRDEEVLACRDDLSCGPIESNDPSPRAAWWARFYEEAEVVSASFGAFWDRVTTTNDRLVVWFGRHSALELSFLLCWADRLGRRPYDVVDVMGLRLPYTKRDGTSAVTQPVQAVSIVPADALKLLFGRERQFTASEQDDASRQWRRLMAENAPFRVVTPEGLVSAPIDYFDPSLMEQATKEWKRANFVVGSAMGHNDDYMQTGDLMLRARVVALVGEGKLLADGDPWDMRTCRIRLPG